MIFYGRRASTLKHGQIHNVTCPNCQNSTSMHYSIFGKYAHIYWIPTFPMGKENILECNHCKQTYKLKELPDQIKQKFELEKHSGVPIWHFTGLIIIACFIGLLTYNSHKDDLNKQAYSEHPEVGDVFSIKSETEGRFTCFKVHKVTGDSLFVVFNDYEIDKKYSIDEIDNYSNYTSEPEGYKISEIKALFDDGIIYDIDRK